MFLVIGYLVYMRKVQITEKAYSLVRKTVLVSCMVPEGQEIKRHLKETRGNTDKFGITEEPEVTRF